MLTGFREAGVVMDYNLLFSVQNLSFLLEGAVVLRSEHASESRWGRGGVVKPDSNSVPLRRLLNSRRCCHSCSEDHTFEDQ